jgi:hypothetical protein
MFLPQTLNQRKNRQILMFSGTSWRHRWHQPWPALANYVQNALAMSGSSSGPRGGVVDQWMEQIVTPTATPAQDVAQGKPGQPDVRMSSATALLPVTGESPLGWIDALGYIAVR